MHPSRRINTLVLGLLSTLSLSDIGHCKVEVQYVSIKQFPFQVSIEIDKNHFCGGAIVGDQWVMTAGSCMPENTTEVDRVRVRAGSSYLASGGAFHSVSKLKRFGRNEFMDYMAHSNGTDFGMIKVESPFHYSSFVQWSNPSLEAPQNSTRFAAAGWVEDKKSKKKKIRLQKVTLKNIKREECQDILKDKVNITENMGCYVGATKKDDPCIMNIGSPIGADGLIYAVVSNKDFCRLKKHPIIVTLVDNLGGYMPYVMAEFLPR